MKVYRYTLNYNKSLMFRVDFLQHHRPDELRRFRHLAVHRCRRLLSTLSQVEAASTRKAHQGTHSTFLSNLTLPTY